jgi:hypothetical protein
VAKVSFITRLKKKISSFEDKLNSKSLFIIITILLIGIVAFWRLQQSPEKVEAGWWNEGWGYRRVVSVTNDTSYGATNTPYKVEIDTQTLISDDKFPNAHEDAVFPELPKGDFNKNDSDLPF